jgi:hypothetical protein
MEKNSVGCNEIEEKNLHTSIYATVIKRLRDKKKKNACLARKKKM